LFEQFCNRTRTSQSRRLAHRLASAHQSAALRAVPEKEWFGAGSAPILELQAYDDTVAQRKFAHILKEQLGERVTVAVIRNAGHALMPEQPQAVIDELTKWARALP
jgi:alpha-beta hydrolase superfamily lysophospholipase